MLLINCSFSSIGKWQTVLLYMLQPISISHRVRDWTKCRVEQEKNKSLCIHTANWNVKTRLCHISIHENKNYFSCPPVYQKTQGLEYLLHLCLHLTSFSSKFCCFVFFSLHISKNIINIFLAFVLLCFFLCVCKTQFVPISTFLHF